MYTNKISKPGKPEALCRIGLSCIKTEEILISHEIQKKKMDYSNKLKQGHVDSVICGLFNDAVRISKAEIMMNE
jgi:hypothetical protein